MSIAVIVTYVAFFPLIRLTGFGRKEPRLNSITDSTTVRTGRILEQLFSVCVSSIKIPVAYRHERDVSLALSRVKGRIFVDVGANQGYYCCVLKDNFELLVAVEPSHENIRIMNRVFGLSHVKPDLIPFAVSNREGFANLLLTSYGSGNRISFESSNEDPSTPHLRVKTITVDSVIEKYGQVDLIKVDVEGAEWLVLAGAERTNRSVKRWVVEVHDLADKIKMEQWMTNHGYHFQWLNNNHIFSWRS